MLPGPNFDVREYGAQVSLPASTQFNALAEKGEYPA